MREKWGPHRKVDGHDHLIEAALPATVSLHVGPSARPAHTHARTHAHGNAGNRFPQAPLDRLRQAVHHTTAPIDRDFLSVGSLRAWLIRSSTLANADETGLWRLDFRFEQNFVHGSFAAAGDFGARAGMPPSFAAVSVVGQILRVSSLVRIYVSNGGLGSFEDRLYSSVTWCFLCACCHLLAANQNESVWL